MKKIFLVFVFTSITLLAQDAGKTGLSFLKFGFGAKNIAMGDAATSTALDVTSLHYNPANLANIESAQIMVMHNEWIQDIRSEELGATARIWGIPLAFGYKQTAIEGIEVRQQASVEPVSKFNANYWALSLSTGLNIVEDISVGASVRYLVESIFADDATGYGLDFGASYRTPINNLSISAVVKNLGSMGKLDQEETRVPADFRIGASYSYPVAEKFSINGAVDYQKYLDAEINHINIGAEIVYDNLVAIRGGYQTGYEDKSISAGLGIMYKSIHLDYAFVPFSSSLGSANLVSLSYIF